MHKPPGKSRSIIHNIAGITIKPRLLVLVLFQHIKAAAAQISLEDYAELEFQLREASSREMEILRLLLGAE